MDQDGVSDHFDDLDGSEALPRPKHFVVAPVLDGAYHRSLPTITAVYVGCSEVPDMEELMCIDGGILDRDQINPNKLEICLFLPGPPGAADGIEVETFSYELTSETKIIEEFWTCVKRIKAFVFAVSTDNYYFYCRISTETSKATSLKGEPRLLN